jgi:hypothetical protein
MNYPTINGSAVSFAELFFSVAGPPVKGVKAINWSRSIERGKVYGTSRRKLSMTSGQADYEADFELYEADWFDLMPQLAQLGKGGVADAIFSVSLSYVMADDEGLKVHTAALKGCRVKKEGQSHSQGTEPLSVKIDLDVMEIVVDGISWISPTAQ